jgi:hypothetical protein
MASDRIQSLLWLAFQLAYLSTTFAIYILSLLRKLPLFFPYSSIFYYQFSKHCFKELLFSNSL